MRRSLAARVEAMEAAARADVPRAPPALVDETHEPQAAAIRDAARLKVLLCTRRAGKSRGVAVEFLTDGWAHPGANYLYIGLTRDAAKKAIWKDGLKAIDHALGLGLDFNESDLTCTLPNGAVIYVLGMDAGEKQKEKARGGKYRKVAIDEAQSFGVDLRELVKVLRPALADARGTLILAGTPGDVPAGLFFDLTHDQDPQAPGRWTRDDADTATRWSGHRWNAGRNPHMRLQWEAELAEMLAINPRVVETPGFVREYLGRWVRDPTKLVYRYQPGFNDFAGDLPKLVRGGWHYVLGLDLGHSPDPTSFVVAAYHDHDRTLYLIEADEALRLDITDVADRVRAYQERFEFDALVVDGANKQAVEEMRRRHGLPLVSAEKQEKADFIRLMNDDFAAGRIKLDPARCAWDVTARPKNHPAGLADQYAKLVWDERALMAPKPRREEHPACQNHAADAALYAWRHCYQYLSEIPGTPPVPGSPEARAAEVASMREARERELERAARETRGELMPDAPSGDGWAEGWE